MARPKRAGVPVIPNASKVRGRVMRVARSGDEAGSFVEIAVDEARDVDRYPNFAEHYVGKVIPVYLHAELHPALAPSDHLEASIAFRGDERGGRFVVIEDDIQRVEGVPAHANAS